METWERFESLYQPEPNTGCWLWTGAISGQGYPYISIGGRKGGAKRAHRIAYELFIGSIPKGYTIDHLCRERTCVNPKHLEAVTMGDMVMCGVLKTHCVHGHEYTKANTYIAPKGDRRCRKCM